MTVQKQDGLFTDVGQSGADLRGKEQLFAAHDNNMAVVVAGGGAAIIGVISEGKNVGAHTSYNTKGNPILRVIAGAALAADQQVISDAQGRAVPAGNGVVGWGRARKAVSGVGVTAAIIPN